jgi:type II secretion system protein D
VAVEVRSPMLPKLYTLTIASLRKRAFTRSLSIFTLIAVLTALYRWHICVYATEQTPEQKQEAVEMRGGEQPSEKAKGAPPERQGQPYAEFKPQFEGKVSYDKELKLLFSFVRADIEHVIQFFSKVTGKVFVLHPQLEGTVTIIAPSPLTVEQAFEVLSAVLNVRGFTMLGSPKDFIIKIVPLSEAKTQATQLRTEVKTAESGQESPTARPIVPADQLVTQVIPLRYANAKQLQQELAPLVSAQNALITSTTAGNLLIITDTERNIERLLNIVRMVDVSVAEAMELAIIKLKHADAEQLAQVLVKLFGIVEPAPARPPAQPGQPPQPEGARQPAQPQQRAVEMQVQVVAEPRTNSLIVWASKERMKMIRELVEQLDIETTELLTFEVIQLKHADAVEVDRILSEIFELAPGGRVEGGATPTLRLPRTAETTRGVAGSYAIISSDPRTNSLVVAATEGKMQFIKSLVEKLDVDITPPIEVQVIPLKYADAVTLADTLKTLFQEGIAGTRVPQEIRGQFERFRARMASRSRGELERQVAIASDERANALIVAATKENIELIKQLVSELDKDFAPPVMARVFKLQYADAAQVADVLNQLFEQTQGGQRGFFWWWTQRQPTTRPSRLVGLRQNAVEADVRTNSVIVAATEENMREFERLIRELDQPAALTNLVRVYKIQNVNARELADTINSILAQQRRPTGFFFFVFAALQRQFQGPLRNLQDISVTADTKTNSLIVTAPPYAFDVVEQLIEQLDTVLPQVFIEVMIVDVTLTKELELGVEWAVLQRKLFGESVDSKLGTQLGVEQIQGGLSWEVVSKNFQALLKTLATQNKVRVLATPHILTLDNTPATITIGKSYPVPRNVIITATGPQYTIAFEDIALTLEVTPHINNSGYVLMDIRQTINDIAEKVVLQGQELPVITKREAQASVQVKDGQTVVIGGILKHDLRKFVQGVPLLKDLPVFGSLFSRVRDLKERTELMVFITPRIIRTGEELQSITEKEKRSLTYPHLLKKLTPEGGEESLKEPKPNSEEGSNDEANSAGSQGGEGKAGKVVAPENSHTITIDDLKLKIEVGAGEKGQR